jgi:alpha-tubulin suppressor-like RCC1 family protein
MASLFKNLQIRRGTNADFNDKDPVLKAGEPAVAIDTQFLKIGDGTSKWSELPTFSSAIINTIEVDIPTIESNNSETVTITVDGIDSINDYSILVTPSAPLPEHIDLRYAYVSSVNEVSIVFTNTDNSNGAFSLAQSGAKLTIFSYLLNIPTITVTTTTTPDPIVDDMFSWGFNEFGQLALGDRTDRKDPTFIFDNNKKWTKISGGNYHTLAIDVDRELHSVGYNYYGQLGLGDHGAGTNKLQFTKVTECFFNDGSLYSDNAEWSHISAGSYHSLAIDTSGNLFSCGDGSYGALGLGDVQGRNKFTLVGEQFYFADLDRLTGSGTNGTSFTLNDIDNDKYKFVANSGLYQITGIPSSNPITVTISRPNSVKDSTHVNHFFVGPSDDDYIPQGGNELVAYSGDVLEATIADQQYYSGTVEIDVSGDYQRISIQSLNDNMDNFNEIVHYQSPNSTWLSIGAGNHHSAGVQNSGLYAWGQGNFGQNASGENENVLFPRGVKKLDSLNNRLIDANDEIAFSQVAAGKNHSLAIGREYDENGVIPTSDPTVFTFGDNTDGQLGIGGAIQSSDLIVPVSFDFSQIVDTNNIEFEPVMYYREDGFGNMYFRKTGDFSSFSEKEKYILQPATEDLLSNDPEYRSGLYRIRNVQSDNPIAILNGGKEDKITYSGDSKRGCRILNDTTADGKYDFYSGDVYVRVLGDFDKVSVYTMDNGYLGKNIFYFSEPVYNPVKVSAGANHSVVLTGTDQVLTFGKNHKGQLGAGDTDGRNFPYRLPESNIKNIDAGGDHTLFVDGSKYVWSFGDNQNGQLGLGDNTSRSSATRIDNTIRWQNVYAGASHSFATVFAFYPNALSNFQVKNASTSNLVGHRQLAITWDHITAYEEAITNYIVEYSSDSGASWFTYSDNALAYKFTEDYIGAARDTEQSTTFTYIIDGLNDSDSYLVRVAGQNATGTGQFTESSQPVSPVEAIDSDFSSVVFYSHLDNSGLDDISGFPPRSPETFFNTNATRYLAGEFAEALRLYQYDGARYSNSDGITLSAEFTIEFFFNPRNYTNTQNGEGPEARIFALRGGSEDKLKLSYQGSDATDYSFSLYKHNSTTNDADIKVCDINNEITDGFAHIAITRTSGAADNPSSYEVVRMFYNGNLISSGRDDSAYLIDNIIFASGNNFYDFDIDEFRVSDIVRYDHEENFNPTTKPFGI